MSKVLKKIILTIVILVVAFLVALVWYKSQANYKATSDIKLEVVAGAKVDDIANNLWQVGLIKSPLIFKIEVRLAGKQDKLQAGNYVIKAGNDMSNIISLLVRGEVDYNEKNILIKEGMRLTEINKYLQDNKMLADDCSPFFSTYISKLPDNLKNYDFLREAPTKVDLEGYFFPDTYRVFADATCEELITKALNNFNNKFDAEMRAEVKRQNKTIFQILTMASVLEKEVKSEADMKIVSGIFWDRIKNGQRLESCATLAYILGENKPQYTLADTQIDSPYNTYRNDGLPPTPINNPGLKAIRAAIYPTKTDYNYFLSRPDTGETVFGKTFEEHKANKAKYLK
jgi:UPF0755 protein